MWNFCTYFDSNYLPQGLALRESLVRHAVPFRLWVLCFDNRAHDLLLRLSLPEIVPILLSEFEQSDGELLRVKQSRSRIEYYFTCSPSLPLYVLKQHSEVDLITYLDADLYFFDSPAPLFDEMGDKSIQIVGHRFSSRADSSDLHGLYNVSFLSFRRDASGLKCLHWWRERCLEWCHDTPELGRFADQKYLDDWPTRFERVHVLQHKGGGLAPWNVDNYRLTHENGRVFVDAEPLVYFHFHGLRRVTGWLFDANLTRYHATACRVLRRYIYGPYLAELQDAQQKVRRTYTEASTQVRMGSVRPGIGLQWGKHTSGLRALVERLKDCVRLLKKWSRGDLMLVTRSDKK